jgi:octaheme c-type cytochrome (tetrathionate reductase family)
MTTRILDRLPRLAAVALIGALLGLAGCSGDDGKDGTDGMDGMDGAPGATGPTGSSGSPGINCWDLNQNGIADLPDEDINKDGKVDVNDCRAATPGYDPVSLHKGYFTENTYVGTSQCLACHGKIGDDVMTTAHWKWEGVASGLTGFEGAIHGKKDMINNFCQAVPGNEGRCAQCHIGYGWTSKSFNFGDPKNIDCLACHDQTGTYKKAAAPGGAPEAGIDLQKIAQSVGENQGVPPRATCVFCHASAGGDDNVKHGDISKRMGFAKATDPAADPVTYLDRSEDVHMGYDPVAKRGGDMLCVACHQVKKDSAGNTLSHGIGGFMFHSVDEGHMKECTDCHEASIHVGKPVENIVFSTQHARLACQVCHIPAIARKVSTYIDWRWESAGLDAAPASCAAEPKGIDAKGVASRGTYNKMKGCFTYGNNVRPELRFYNGKWNRMIVGLNDKYTSLPVDIGSPSATYKDADAKIYPFKKMTGNQAADKNNKTVLVPHLWGTVTGPNPYWGKYDWVLALQDNANYLPAYNTGTPIFTGEYEFVDTVGLLKVDHEIAPAAQALGKNGCADCHQGNQIDWAALGWSGDPILGNATRQ